MIVEIFRSANMEYGRLSKMI